MPAVSFPKVAIMPSTTLLRSHISSVGWSVSVPEVPAKAKRSSSVPSFKICAVPMNFGLSKN